MQRPEISVRLAPNGEWAGHPEGSWRIYNKHPGEKGRIVAVLGKRVGGLNRGEHILSEDMYRAGSTRCVISRVPPIGASLLGFP